MVKPTKDLPQYHPQTIAVKLSPVGERSVRMAHPWLFSNSIKKLNKTPNAGDIAVIFDHRDNRVMGVGLMDPDSAIRIKMVHFGSGAALDGSFFRQKIETAQAHRAHFHQSSTSAYRLIFGENDGMPGLIVDRYNDVLVMKVYALMWAPYLALIRALLIEVTHCRAIVFRAGRQFAKGAKEFPWLDGMVIHGDLINETVHFTEHGVNFSANLIQGHKTGFFLDHRANRKRVGQLAKGRSVLDVFSYAGGFSVHSLVSGAQNVTSIDISEKALLQAKANAQLNQHSGQHQTICGDAFVLMKEMIQTNQQFGLVVIDPPSFAKSAAEQERAIKKYEEIAALGAQLVGPGGWLVLASCSSRVNSEDFYQANNQGFEKSKTRYTLKETHGHDADHPIGFPEGAYLKCGYYKKIGQ
ncbi:MAG: class I SAM-dependent rRNA methyltransferase [Flavobacteriaceae bacterium]|nr:class I SAM-dependent rRNA methyltransferase [Flavobacteriaceae bacterium]